MDAKKEGEHTLVSVEEVLKKADNDGNAQEDTYGERDPEKAMRILEDLYNLVEKECHAAHGACRTSDLDALQDIANSVPSHMQLLIGVRLTVARMPEKWESGTPALYDDWRNRVWEKLSDAFGLFRRLLQNLLLAGIVHGVVYRMGVASDFTLACGWQLEHSLPLSSREEGDSPFLAELVGTAQNEDGKLKNIVATANDGQDCKRVYCPTDQALKRFMWVDAKIKNDDNKFALQGVVDLRECQCIDL